MGTRAVLKSLKKFSKQELKEKKAKQATVHRIKMKPSMRRGKFPNMRVKKIEGAHYLVCVFHNNKMRVYYFDKNGKMMSAEKFEGEDKKETWKNISNKTKTKFRFKN